MKKINYNSVTNVRSKILNFVNFVNMYQIYFYKICSNNQFK